MFFLGKTSTIHIELLFWNAPAKSSWTDLSLVWFAGATPELHGNLEKYVLLRQERVRKFRTQWVSDSVRVRFRVRFQVVKVPIFGGFPVENPTKKANRLKALLRGISLSEYGSEGFRVRSRRSSKYGSVAYLVERPTRETQAEQYSDTVLGFSLPKQRSRNSILPVFQPKVLSIARQHVGAFQTRVSKTCLSMACYANKAKKVAQESPRQTKHQRKGQNEKYLMNFAHFSVNSGVFSLGKQARFTHWTFVPECPCEKFMNWLSLVWFAGATPEESSPRVAEK